MPVRPDGRLDIEKCLRWHRENIIPRCPKPGAQAVAGPVAQTGDSAEAAQRLVIDSLRRKAAEIPPLLARLGCPASVILAGINLVDSYIWASVGADAMFRLYPAGDFDIREPDYHKLIGREVSATDNEAADAIVAAVDAFFGFEE